MLKARELPFDGRLEEAEKLKKTGNDALEKGDYDAANHCYEQCLSVFKWAENTDPNWKNKGIRDETLVEKSWLGDNEEEEKKVREEEDETFILFISYDLALCRLTSRL